MTVGPGTTGPLRPDPKSGESSAPVSTQCTAPREAAARRFPSQERIEAGPVTGPPGAVDQHDRVAGRAGHRTGGQRGDRGGGVAEPRVQRRVRDGVAGPRVVGAVVEHHREAVAAPRGHQPARSGHHPRHVAVLDRQGQLGVRPRRMAGGKQQPEHPLGRPVRRAEPRTGLPDRRPGAVPARPQQPLTVRGSPVGEVPEHAAGHAAHQPRRLPAGPGDRADPERRGGGEPLGEAAALQQRGAVHSDQPDRVVEVRPQILRHVARRSGGHSEPPTSNGWVQRRG